jgi:hypothetical protein
MDGTKIWLLGTPITGKKSILLLLKDEEWSFLCRRPQEILLLHLTRPPLVLVATSS